MVELARGRRVEEVNEREGQFTVFIMTLAWHFHADRHSERNVPRNKRNVYWRGNNAEIV